jgi:hypothetical protein
MGWLWASTSSPAKGPNDDKAVSTPSRSQPEPASTYGDPEIAKFMAQLQSEFGSKPSEPEPPRTTSSQPPPPTTTTTKMTGTLSLWTSLWGPTAQSSSSTPSRDDQSSAGRTNRSQEPDATPPTSTASSTPPSGSEKILSEWTEERLDPVSESLLPTSMSCRHALDAAFYCQSPGGQWNAVYREGTVRSCNAHWEDLWFCMRTRAMGSGPVKEEAIRAHYRRRELARYGPGRPASTDVWELREEKVPYDSVFRAPYQASDISDEEWWAMEIRRRREIQRALAEAEAAAKGSGGETS